MLVHGDNLRQKERSQSRYADEESRVYLTEIRTEYDKWHAANLLLTGPIATSTEDESRQIITERAMLFEDYKNFIDQQRFAEKFDSRSNLHSTVLEEFMYYLFRDLVAGFGSHALIGKSHSFKDIFFAPPSFTASLRRPYISIERKDHDFVIGTTVEASFHATTSPSQDPNVGETQMLITTEPSEYDSPTVTSDAESHIFDIPAVAIECKTYLDKTMLEGSSRAAEELKARIPNGIYIVVMEWLKLTGAVNLQKYKVNQIYVLRKQRNTDREYRFLPNYEKKPVDPDVVFHLFEFVREHLTANWAVGIEDGLRRGWLIK